MSEWARGKAESLGFGHYYCEDSWYSCPLAEDGCADDRAGDKCRCGLADDIDKIAAALDDARREGEQEASAAYKKGYIRGLNEGAERERWACFHLADEPESQFVAEAIRRRGPMRGPEEE